jgi:choice-of-anchor A domain-containing protein
MFLLLALAAWTPQTTGRVALAADCSGQLGPMGDFNGFVFGDMPYKNGTVDGRLAVGGNATFETGVGVDVGLTLTPNAGRDDLIVGGNLTYQSGDVVSGGITYAGTGNISGKVTAFGGIRNAPPSQARPPLDFAAAQTFATNLSATLAGFPANGTYSSTASSLTITGTDPATNVIVVPAAVLSSSSNTTVNAPAGSTVIINVTGPQPAIGFTLTITGTDSGHVLWNFPQATSLVMKNIEMLGTVLAPAATVTFSNGGMSGQLISASLTTPNAVLFTDDGQGR